jgi:hypothetical protein
MTCRDCYYHWFKGLVEWCFHPAHDKQIKRPVGCVKFQSATKKVMPNEKGEYDYGYPGRLER